MHQPTSATLHLLTLCSLLVLLLPTTAAAQQLELTMSPVVPQPLNAEPPLPSYPVQLVLDDDQPESAFGINGATSLQFLWFQQLAFPGPFTLEEIWVLFPGGSNMVAGAPVELVVFQDDDSDPGNGATLLASYDQTIQVVDGNTFSIYPVSLAITSPGEILIGVINRFTDPAVTPPLTEPAAVDTSTGQGRSWWALWNGPVPSPPVLPPDLALERLEASTAGNWMIRGFGSTLLQPAIPVLGRTGTLVLLGLLVLLGALLAWRIGGRP